MSKVQLPKFNIISRFEKWRKQWGNPKDFYPSSYISQQIHPDDILILSGLLYPECIEVEGCIFMAERFNEGTYRQLKVEYGGNTQALEYFFNHTHMYDVFDQSTESISDAVYENVARLLQYSWSVHLQNQFPDKDIVVEFYPDDYGPTICFLSK